MAVSRSRVVTALAFAALAGGSVTPILTSCSPEREAVAPAASSASSAEGLDPPVRKSIAEARRRIVEQPRSGGTWGHLGMVLQVHGLHGDALEAYREAARLDPVDPRWPHLSGIVCELLSLHGDAATAYSRAVDLNARDLVALCSWARILQDRGADDEARRLYLRALDIDRRAVAARVGLGQLAARAGQDEIAEKSFTIALEAFPRCGPAHTELSRIYSRRGDERKAAFHGGWSRVLGGKLPLPDALMDALQELGVSYVARMKRAELALRREQPDLAEENYRAAIALRETLAEPRYRLGLTLARLEKAEEAIEQLRAASRLSGSSWRVDALVQLSALHAARKEWTLAGEALDEADAIERDAARIIVQRGKLRFLERRSDEALAEFERAIALHPGVVDAYLEKGALLLIEGKAGASTSLSEEDRKTLRCRKTEAALEVLERALALRVDQAAAYDLAGSARMVLRQTCEESAETRARLLGEAIVLFSTQVAYFPSRRKGYLQLARALGAAGETGKAAECLQRARALWPDDERFSVPRRGPSRGVR